jgi:hypothetical protein
VNTTFPTGLVAVVTGLDFMSQPIPVEGAQVTFTAPGSGASGTFGGPNVVFTDPGGFAVAPPFTANAIGGS